MTSSKFNVFINKKTININDRAFSFGDGVFETILVKDNQIIFLEKHLKRLHQGCEKLKIIKPPLNILKDNCYLCIGKTKNCILKIVVSRGISSHGYGFPKLIKHNIYFFKKRIDKKEYNKTIKLGVANYLPSENVNLSKIKHLNRLDQCLTSHELLYKKKIQDLVILHRGNIIECISSNIFFVKNHNNMLIFDTPFISDIGVEGIMRNEIIKYLKKNKYKVNIKNIAYKGIDQYMSCFKVNSITGIIFIDRLEKNKFSSPQMLYNILNKFLY